MKYWIGPMSKNVVDAVIDFDGDFGFIPSRRQVDYNGGYVNNWTTGEFAKYVNGRALIQRDHGGIGQGYQHDGGYKSFMCDSKYFDILHIDPWKWCTKFEDGIQQTIDYINYVYLVLDNHNIKFEVGTEESIRRFEDYELERLLATLENTLGADEFENIEYAVVQSGVGLDLGKQTNTGTFNPERLSKMVEICKKYGKKSKEHNGDYLTDKEYKDRFDLGLDSINIAPEFGQIETLCYLDEMGDDIEEYYKICYNSGRWEKWVDKKFVPEDNKRELIKICGHYVFSEEKFLEIKPDIDNKIQNTIKEKLSSMV